MFAALLKMKANNQKRTRPRKKKLRVGLDVGLKCERTC